jgi:hypothetical protein
LQEVTAIFKPKEGTLGCSMRVRLQCPSETGTQYAAGSGGLNLNPQFVYFFNQAARFSRRLPEQRAEPRLVIRCG